MTQFIGIDIGGTKMKGGVITESGKVIEVIEERTNKSRLCDQLLYFIEYLIKDADISGIGISTAGRVDFENGVINYATDNLPNWKGTRVKELIASKFSYPVVVDNDGNCAAYGELKIGSGQNLSNFLCLTLGTGVGSGLVINRGLYRGTNGGAGEIGHMTLIPNGRLCNCGRKGCFEQYVSGTGLESDIKNSDELNDLQITPSSLFRLANDKNPCAKGIVDSFIDHLVTGLISLQSILDVDGYILGGGIIDSSEYWWDGFLKKMEENFITPILVKKAMLKNDAGMIGAALMARDILQEINRGVHSG